LALRHSFLSHGPRRFSPRSSRVTPRVSFRLLAVVCGVGILPAQAALAQEAYGGAVERPAPKPAPAPAPVLTKAPQLLEGAEPVYPEEAKQQQLSADVTLVLEIGEDGTVRSAEVTRPAGHGFDEAAVEAAKRLRFSPAEVDGKPAPVKLEWTQHFVFTAPPPAPAETEKPQPPPVTLSGRVLERGSRKPVPGATVLAGAQEAATTAPDGSFALHLSPGKVALTVQDPDHHPFETQETVKPGERLEVTYYLMPRLIGLNETVVRSNREKKEVTRRTLTREELEKVPGSFGDPVRVLQNLPGLARVPFGGGQLIVRGASPNDTGTYLDGVQIPLLYHFGGGPSVINPEFVDKIDFYPGGFGAEYGRAIGGIVDVGTRTPVEGEFHGSASVDLINSGAYVAAPIVKGLTVSAAARRSYIDAFLPLVLRGSSTVVSPFYYDYQGRVDYHPEGSRHSFQLFAFGSDDELKVVVGRGGTSDLQLNNQQWFQRAVAGWTYRGDAFSQRAQLYVGRNGESTGVGTIRRDQRDDVLGLRERLEWKASPLFTLRGGLDAQLTWSTLTTFAPAAQNDYRGFPGERPDTDREAVTLKHDAFPYAEWLEGQFSFGRVKVIPGLRAEQYRVQGLWKTDVDPRLVVRTDVGGAPDVTVLKGSVGLYHEAPGPGTLDATTGNPDLPLQAAFQAALGVEHKFTDAINVDVTGFYNRRYDLAQRTGAVETLEDGTLKRLNYAANGLGRAYGIEVFLRHELTRNFFGWVAYTLSWSESRTAGGDGYHLTSFDQRHILTLIGQYKFGNGWELGGRFRLVSGNPTTPYIGSTFDADTQTYSPITGEALSARLPTFHQLDLRVDKTWLFDVWSLGLYLDVQNVYNQPNQEAVQNDYRYKTQQVITGLPILPTFGIKGTF